MTEAANEATTATESVFSRMEELIPGVTEDETFKVIRPNIERFTDAATLTEHVREMESLAGVVERLGMDAGINEGGAELVWFFPVAGQTLACEMKLMPSAGQLAVSVATLADGIWAHWDGVGGDVMKARYEMVRDRMLALEQGAGESAEQTGEGS